MTNPSDEIRKLLSILISECQGLRIQQVQLLEDSKWDKERYQVIADTCWKNFNEAHKKLTLLLRGNNA